MLTRSCPIGRIGNFRSLFLMAEMNHNKKVMDDSWRFTCVSGVQEFWLLR